MSYQSRQKVVIVESTSPQEARNMRSTGSLQPRYPFSIFAMRFHSPGFVLYIETLLVNRLCSKTAYKTQNETQRAVVESRRNQLLVQGTRLNFSATQSSFGFTEVSDSTSRMNKVIRSDDQRRKLTEENGPIFFLFKVIFVKYSSCSQFFTDVGSTVYKRIAYGIWKEAIIGRSGIHFSGPRNTDPSDYSRRINKLPQPCAYSRHKSRSRRAAAPLNSSDHVPLVSKVDHSDFTKRFRLCIFSRFQFISPSFQVSLKTLSVSGLSRIAHLSEVNSPSAGDYLFLAFI